MKNDQYCTQAEVVTWLDERLQDVLDNPGAWGGEVSLEPVALCLIMLREEFRDPQNGPAKVRHTYRKHLARLRKGNSRREGRPGGGLDALVAQLRTFSKCEFDEVPRHAAPPSPISPRPLPGSNEPIEVGKLIKFTDLRPTG
jgi:hypothetical protein